MVQALKQAEQNCFSVGLTSVQDAGLSKQVVQRRVDKMEVVYQAEPLSMGWCLDCHRDPEPILRPVEEITNMAWAPAEDRRTVGARLREQYNINPSEDCSTCHR